MIKSIQGLEYKGVYHNQFWNKDFNPNATIDNALANCTTFVYGDVLVDRNKPIVSRITNASNFHNNLINGWLAIPFDYSKLKVGDVIEWSNKNHVARYSQKNYVSASFYTGIHGKAYYNGTFDNRKGINSLEELSNFMIANYPKRFFHFQTLAQEISQVGGEPNYILVEPLKSVLRKTNLDQIQVLTDVQYVRDKDNNIVSGCEKGYYNVLSTRQDENYTWYEVEKNKYIAGVNNRVVYLPKENKINIDEVIEENKKLKELLNKINKLSEV